MKGTYYIRRQLLVVLVFPILLLCPRNLVAQTPDASYLAFKPGEILEYNVHYGFINAASLKLMVDENIYNKYGYSLYFLDAVGKSYKGWDLFFKVRDYYYSYIDTSTLLPVYAVRDIYEGGYTSKEIMLFNQKENTIVCNKTEYEVPTKIFDLLSAIYYARCFDVDKLEWNKMIPFNTFFEHELFPVGITITGKEIIETDLGKFRCLVLRPTLVEGRVFKGQSDMTIYVTDDLNNIPVRVESAIFIGYVKADLIKFENLRYPLSSLIE